MPSSGTMEYVVPYQSNLHFDIGRLRRRTETDLEVWVEESQLRRLVDNSPARGVLRAGAAVWQLCRPLGSAAFASRAWAYLQYQRIYCLEFTVTVS